MAGVLTGFLAGLALDVAPPGQPLHRPGRPGVLPGRVRLRAAGRRLLRGRRAGTQRPVRDRGDGGRGGLRRGAGGPARRHAQRPAGQLAGDHQRAARPPWPTTSCCARSCCTPPRRRCAWPGVRREDHRPGCSASQARASQARAQLPTVGQGAIRQLASGNGPRLRLSERDRGPVSARRPARFRRPARPGPGRPAARREPQLKLGRPAARAGAAFAPSGLASGSARVKFGGRRREGVLGGSLLGVGPGRAACSAARCSAAPRPPSAAARSSAGPRRSAGRRRSGTGLT